MSEAWPILCRYEGDGFKPASGFWQRRADKLFTVGADYYLVEHQERSHAQHRAFFASVREAFNNLPEDRADEFANPDSLRKYALIRAGHCNQHHYTCASKAKAHELAAFLRGMDNYAVIDVKGSVVTCYVAHSQSYRSMDRETFKRSFDDVLRVLSELIGTTPAELSQAGEAA